MLILSAMAQAGSAYSLQGETTMPDMSISKETDSFGVSWIDIKFNQINGEDNTGTLVIFAVDEDELGLKLSDLNTDGSLLTPKEVSKVIAEENFAGDFKQISATNLEGSGNLYVILTRHNGKTSMGKIPYSKVGLLDVSLDEKSEIPVLISEGQTEPNNFSEQFEEKMFFTYMHFSSTAAFHHEDRLITGFRFNKTEGGLLLLFTIDKNTDSPRFAKISTGLGTDANVRTVEYFDSGYYNDYNLRVADIAEGGNMVFVVLVNNEGAWIGNIPIVTKSEEITWQGSSRVSQKL